MEDFNLFSQKDRQDMSYGACIGASVLLGAAVGRFGMLPGLLAGAAAGLALGLLTCKRLSPALEQKIFSSTAQLSEPELLSVLRVIRDETGIRTKSEAMYLLSQARAAALSRGESIRTDARSCMPARLAASQLLARRA